MNRCALLFLLALGCTEARAQTVSDAEAKEGFVSLFNGKDWSGWQFGSGHLLPPKVPKNWSIADGLIALSGGGSPHLGTQWDYDDFDVRFEWRALRKGYNSGFYVRSGRKVGANQINLAQSDCGHLMGGARGGKKVPELQKPPGEWNAWRALAVGDKLTFWCNDKLAWEVTGFKPRRGYLGLQAEGAAMAFRNLRIKEIGWENLSNLKKWQSGPKGVWKVEGDALVGTGNGARLNAVGLKVKDYVLRLEWKCGGKGRGAVVLGGEGSRDEVSIGTIAGGSGGSPVRDKKPAKATDNPPGQWNYLEIRVADRKATVWQNGSVVTELIGLFGGMGGLSLQCEEEALSFRNLRIKVGKS